MTEKTIISINTAVLCQKMLETGKDDPEGLFNWKVPPADKIQACMDLLRAGDIRVRIIPPNHTDAPSWSDDRRAHKLDYEFKPERWRHVTSHYLVDNAFLDEIRPREGEQLFACTETDGELRYYKFGPIAIVTADSAKFEIEEDDDCGDTDFLFFSKFRSVESLAGHLGDMGVSYYDSSISARPLQVILRGWQFGSVALLHQAARERRLSKLPIPVLTQQCETNYNDIWALVFPDHLGDKPLHMAARTGEIVDLPEQVLQLQFFFYCDREDLPVVACARDSKVLDWMVKFFASRSEEEWKEVYCGDDHSKFPPEILAVIPEDALNRPLSSLFV